MTTAIAVPGLPFALTVEGQPPCGYVLRDGELAVTGRGGTDMFIDPAGGVDPPDAGRLMGTPPAGDFTLSARVSAGLKSTFDAGVMLVHAGQRQWAKLCLELSPQHQPTAVTVVTRDTSDDSNSFPVSADGSWLRITRTGRAWAFHVSTDGSWWSLLRYFRLADQAAARSVKVGFLAQSPAGDGCTARFRDIAFLAGAPGDLRDGS